MEGRRARLRADLFSEIKAAALSELRRAGASELSLREVAKTAGISPSGLYRYVDGRDGLLELLISDGFESFGRALDEAIDVAGDDLNARLEAAALGYRNWALKNPDQFGLILGTPVPGFSARTDGPTIASVRRFADPMIRVVIGAYNNNHPDASIEIAPATGESAFDAITKHLPSSLTEVIVRIWSRVHGLVALEAFGHLGWSGVDVETLLGIEVRGIADELSRNAVAK